MPRPPAAINKKINYLHEENTRHFCFYCSQKKLTEWHMLGYDEFGELWICLKCWDQAVDISHEQNEKLDENE